MNDTFSDSESQAYGWLLQATVNGRSTGRNGMFSAENTSGVVLEGCHDESASLHEFAEMPSLCPGCFNDSSEREEHVEILNYCYVRKMYEGILEYESLEKVSCRGQQIDHYYSLQQLVFLLQERDSMAVTCAGISRWQCLQFVLNTRFNHAVHQGRVVQCRDESSAWAVFCTGFNMRGGEEPIFIIFQRDLSEEIDLSWRYYSCVPFSDLQDPGQRWNRFDFIKTPPDSPLFVLDPLDLVYAGEKTLESLQLSPQLWDSMEENISFFPVSLSSQGIPFKILKLSVVTSIHRALKASFGNPFLLVPFLHVDGSVQLLLPLKLEEDCSQTHLAIIIQAIKLSRGSRLYQATQMMSLWEAFMRASVLMPVHQPWLLDSFLQTPHNCAVQCKSSAKPITVSRHSVPSPPTRELSPKSTANDDSSPAASETRERKPSLTDDYMTRGYRGKMVEDTFMAYYSPVTSPNKGVAPQRHETDSGDGSSGSFDKSETGPAPSRARRLAFGQHLNIRKTVSDAQDEVRKQEMKLRLESVQDYVRNNPSQIAPHILQRFQSLPVAEEGKMPSGSQEPTHVRSGSSGAIFSEPKGLAGQSWSASASPPISELKKLSFHGSATAAPVTINDLRYTAMGPRDETIIWTGEAFPDLQHQQQKQDRFSREKMDALSQMWSSSTIEVKRPHDEDYVEFTEADDLCPKLNISQLPPRFVVDFLVGDLAIGELAAEQHIEQCFSRFGAVARCLVKENKNHANKWFSIIEFVFWTDDTVRLRIIAGDPLCLTNFYSGEEVIVRRHRDKFKVLNRNLATPAPVVASPGIPCRPDWKYTGMDTRSGKPLFKGPCTSCGRESTVPFKPIVTGQPPRCRNCLPLFQAGLAGESSMVPIVPPTARHTFSESDLIGVTLREFGRGSLQ